LVKGRSLASNSQLKPVRKPMTAKNATQNFAKKSNIPDISNGLKLLEEMKPRIKLIRQIFENKKDNPLNPSNLWLK